MLSPGTWFKGVPRTPGANLAFRLAVSRSAGRAKREQDLLREMCRRDILFFINTFVWQVNPRNKKGGQEVGPFVTWDFQDDAVRTILDHIEDDEDLLIEKSREMGASWLCLIVMDWFSRFHPWKKFLCISHSAEAVDRLGDSDSLFWKIDFMGEHLPPWMPRSDHKKLKITYPETKSSITGAASTERSGVGGRSTSVFLDEFSKQQNDREILGQTADTGCRIFNGTHYGVGTEFYQLTRRPDLKKLVMHWSMHPVKKRGLYRWSEEKKRVELLDPNYVFPPDYTFVLDGSPHGGPFPGLRSPWYDKECLRRANRREVAMHLDIDPQGSQCQYYEPAVIRQLIAEQAVDAYWQGSLKYDPETGEPQGLEPAPGGALRLWLTAQPGGEMPPAPYVVGCDISQGTGATNSCLSVVNGKTGEKVAEYADPNVSPERLAPLAVALCRLFSASGVQNRTPEPARMIWEQQGPGLSFGGAVLKLGFRSIYYRTAELPHSLQTKVSDRPGWVPQPETIQVLHGDYRTALYSREFVNRSKEALEECLAFEYDGRGQIQHAQIESKNDRSGARINHGDRVVADALAWKLAKDIGRVEKKKDEEQVPVGTLAWRRAIHAEREAAGTWW